MFLKLCSDCRKESKNAFSAFFFASLFFLNKKRERAGIILSSFQEHGLFGTTVTYVCLMGFSLVLIGFQLQLRTNYTSGVWPELEEFPISLLQSPPMGEFCFYQWSRVKSLSRERWFVPCEVCWGVFGVVRGF